MYPGERLSARLYASTLSLLLSELASVAPNLFHNMKSCGDFLTASPKCCAPTWGSSSKHAMIPSAVCTSMSLFGVRGREL